MSFLIRKLTPAIQKLIYITVAITQLSATDYYVAISYGDDENNGTTLAKPFKTVSKAASVMNSGDICYIRQGRYHESVTIDNLNGSSGSAIIFTNYNNERVIMDGTIPINSSWTQVGSIFKVITQ